MHVPTSHITPNVTTHTDVNQEAQDENVLFMQAGCFEYILHTVYAHPYEGDLTNRLLDENK